MINQSNPVPEKNQQIIAYTEKHGRSISPTYEKAVCTELVIGILKNFIELTKEDKKRIRIITNEDVYKLRANNSQIPKGVYYALTENGMGIPIDSLKNVKPGDFVQFWYEYWGHCGIVKSLDAQAKTMDLHSSFPSTNGYGVQTFEIPKECYFVRLK
ncbi:MAG: hypothetical protein ACKVQB_06265 [Bacteroidia bacterium]